MGQPSYLCSVSFARAPVVGLSFFVSMNTPSHSHYLKRPFIMSLGQVTEPPFLT